VITDLRLPDGTGHAILESLGGRSSRPACLMVTAFGSVRDAVAALKQGADDFLTKPLEMDHFLLTVERLLERMRMRRELERMRGLVGAGSFHGIVGHSAPMQRLFDQIRLIGRADGPVLIVGESGTGKELVAKAVHAESGRANGPFVAINCAGIPGELIESELFGHEAGAFTGARGRRKGIFAQADGGTLLLDEIGEMPAELQAKLLRVLQEGKVRPVGATGEQEVDVRVLAATHRDVRGLVSDGSFREDLYYRLETFALEVPALRERGDDLELLATHFLRRHAARLEREIDGFDRLALTVLQRYDFPGNVRELSNVVERAVAFCRGGEITVADLPARLTRSAESPSHGDGGDDTLTADLPTMEALQKRYARQVLDRTGGNKQRAAPSSVSAAARCTAGSGTADHCTRNGTASESIRSRSAGSSSMRANMPRHSAMPRPLSSISCLSA
jgi:two-component system, NtrC family, response regulator AtoC